MRGLVWLGSFLWLGSLLLLLFQGISAFIRENYNWKQLALKDVVDAQYLEWVQAIPWTMVHTAADYIVSMPLYILMFATGLICYIISGIFRR